MNKKLIIIVFLILFLISGGIFLWKNEKKEKPKVDVSSVAIPAVNVPPVNAPILDEGVPPEYIVIKETTEEKIVENTKKGISMKVPEGWEVNKFVVDEDLEIRKFGPEQIIETELVDGAILKVYVDDNPENLSIKEYAEEHWQLDKLSPEQVIYTEIEGTFVLKIIKTKIQFSEDENGNPLYKEDSARIRLSINRDKKIYSFGCLSAGQQYEQFNQECENLVKEKIKKNEF